MYDPTQPGVDEARLLVLADTIKAHLAGLNTALQRGGLWPAEYVVQEAWVNIGDIQDMKVTAESGAILICVHPMEDDSSIKRDTVENTYTNGMVRDFGTYISAYINDKALNSANFVMNRELILSRICDFLTDGLFNNIQNASLTMQSNVYSAPGKPDKLKGYIVGIEKSWFGKSYGETNLVRGSRLLHASYVG